MSSRGGLGPAEDWPTTLARHRGTIRVPVHVLPADRSPVATVVDPALREKVRSSVHLVCVNASGFPGARAQLAELEYHTRTDLPVPLVVRVETTLGGRTYELGRLKVLQTVRSYSAGGDGRRALAEALLGPHADVEAITIRLVPDLEHAERGTEPDRIWGETLVYEDVPVRRPGNEHEGEGNTP